MAEGGAGPRRRRRCSRPRRRRRCSGRRGCHGGCHGGATARAAVLERCPCLPRRRLLRGAASRTHVVVTGPGKVRTEYGGSLLGLVGLTTAWPRPRPMGVWGEGRLVRVTRRRGRDRVRPSSTATHGHARMDWISVLPATAHGHYSAHAHAHARVGWVSFAWLVGWLDGWMVGWLCCTRYDDGQLPEGGPRQEHEHLRLHG